MLHVKFDIDVIGVIGVSKTWLASVTIQIFLRIEDKRFFN